MLKVGYCKMLMTHLKSKNVIGIAYSTKLDRELFLTENGYFVLSGGAFTSRGCITYLRLHSAVLENRDNLEAYERTKRDVVYYVYNKDIKEIEKNM